MRSLSVKTGIHVLASMLAVSTGPLFAATVTQIIDASGDGLNGLNNPAGIAVDGSGQVYVTGVLSDNAFKITPTGVITQIIDSTGDGVNGFAFPEGIAVDGSGSVYVSSRSPGKAFRIAPNGVITEIIDETGDGVGHPLDFPDLFSIAGRDAGKAYVTGSKSNNAFGIEFVCVDNDGDGFGSPGEVSCPGGSAEDCDDGDPNNFPGNTEVCDGQDNNCDEQVDEPPGM